MWQNGKALWALQRNLIERANPQLPQPGRNTVGDVNSNAQIRRPGLVELAREGKITRSEMFLIRRGMNDIKKVPLFLLIFAICGEFTPFIVLAVPGVVPDTCKIPRQVQGLREKAEARRRDAFRNLEAEVPEEKAEEVKLEELDRKQLLLVGRSLSAWSRLYDTIASGLGVPLPTRRGQRKRVGRIQDLVAADDILLRRLDPDVQRLSEAEVRIACEIRGLDHLGVPEDNLRETLRRWLGLRAQASISRLLLTRPSAWPDARTGELREKASG